MNISHIEHVGIAVTSLEEAIPYYENILGLKCFAIEEVADQKVKTAFFQVGQTKVELLEATSDDSAIAKFIANNGGRGGIQHIAADQIAVGLQHFNGNIVLLRKLCVDDSLQEHIIVHDHGIQRSQRFDLDDTHRALSIAWINCVDFQVCSTTL